MSLLRRIVSTCLLAVVIAGAMFVARWLGARPDPAMARLINAPSAVESLARRKAADKLDETQVTKSPLVAQAEAFALYLNPPEPVKRTPPPPRVRAVRAEVAPVAMVSVPPKFRLVGISYHRSKPEESKALVWAAGGSVDWVAPGAELGSIVVRQINRGSILYQDAAGMHEMKLEMDAMPARKPQDRQPPKEDAKIAAIAKRKVPPAPEELPPPDSVADVGQPCVEASPAPEDIEPKEAPAPPRSTPGRRPRPIRPVAKQS